MLLVRPFSMVRRSPPSLAGGTNFAWGGACVNAAAPCLNPVPNIGTQVTQYLSLTGGVADPNALYSIWGGANDIFATLTLDPANAQANTVAAAPRVAAAEPARAGSFGKGKSNRPRGISSHDPDDLVGMGAISGRQDSPVHRHEQLTGLHRPLIGHCPPHHLMKVGTG